MKVLFLDIDGVLNSHDNLWCRGALWGDDHGIKSRDEFGQLFDERCVRWLEYIVKNTDCKIVVSSAWRHSGVKYIKDMWAKRELPGEVIGITPHNPSEEWTKKYPSCPFAERGTEIQEWIDKKKPDNYCIVDDDSDMLPHQKFVRVDGEFGLSGKASDEIIKILNTQ